VHLCVGEGGVAGSERAAQRADCLCLPRAANVSFYHDDFWNDAAGAAPGPAGADRRSGLRAQPRTRDVAGNRQSPAERGAGRGARGAGRGATWRRRATARGWWQSASMIDTPARAARERGARERRARGAWGGGTRRGGVGPTEPLGPDCVVTAQALCAGCVRTGAAGEASTRGSTAGRARAAAAGRAGRTMRVRRAAGSSRRISEASDE